MEGFLEGFNIGIDPDKTVVFKVHGDDELTWELWFPVDDRGDFLANFESWAGDIFVDFEDGNRYEVDDGIDKSWLRLLPGNRNAVWSVPPVSRVLEDKRRIIELRRPQAEIESLSSTRASAIARLSNRKVDLASQLERRKTFVAIRTKDFEVIRKRPSEAASEFALRKGSSSIFYDELERFYSESAAIDAQVRLDKQSSELHLAFVATGIDNSSLGNSIA